MQLVRDGHILRLVDQISDHYRSNIANRFIRPALLQLSLEKPTWDLIEALMEKTEQFQYHGYHIDDLYRQISASAKFISATRREVAPCLRLRLAGTSSEGPDKTLKNMAINNFSFNLQLFADLLYDLYIKLVELDVSFSRGKRLRPVYKQIPELEDLGKQLIND